MNALEFKVGDVVESVFSGRQFTVLGVDEGRIRIALDAERWDADRWFLGCYFRLISRAYTELTKPAPEKPKELPQKDDGFIPFDQSKHKIKAGDIARFEFEVTGVDSTGAFVYNKGGTIWYANQLSFIKPGPEPLKVGDIVRNPQWPVGLTAEIAAIKDGVAAFWQWREYATTSPNPCPVTELVRA